MSADFKFKTTRNQIIPTKKWIAFEKANIEILNHSLQPVIFLKTTRFSCIPKAKTQGTLLSYFYTVGNPTKIYPKN